MQFDIDQYNREGFTVDTSILSPDTLSEMNHEIDRITRKNTLERHNKLALEMEPNQPSNGNLVRRIYAPCQHYKSFRELSISNQMLNKVEALIGSDILLHYSKINMKPPKIGTEIKWHQDYVFYPLSNFKSLAVLIYLEDANLKNGCLKVIPKSGANEVLDHTKEGFFVGSVSNEIDTSNALAIEGKAGTCIFFNCLTLHASTQNFSSTSRKALIIGYRNPSAVPLYYGEMTNMMERESKIVRGTDKFTAELDKSLRKVTIPKYKDRITSIYGLQS